MKRKCLAKRLYELATPYVQLLGWLIVTGSVVISGIAIVQQVQAFDGRITALERAFIETDKRYVETDKRLAVMDGKLDIVVERVK